MAKPSFQELPFPRQRLGQLDFLKITTNRAIIHGLIEVDMTDALNTIHVYEARTGDDISVVAFIAHCLATAIAENRMIQAFRVGTRLIVYDDVDVNIMIERDTNDGKFPTQHVLRNADQRSVIAMSDEIRVMQKAPVEKGRPLRMLRFYTRFPAFIRVALIRLLQRYPHQWKAMGGTTAITSVGMFGEGSGWGIPVVPIAIMITLGGMGKKPAVVDGHIEIRELLCVTLSFDHAITDGAPAARFTTRFKELVESCCGLEECATVAAETAEVVGV